MQASTFINYKVAYIYSKHSSEKAFPELKYFISIRIYLPCKLQTCRILNGKSYRNIHKMGVVQYVSLFPKVCQIL